MNDTVKEMGVIEGSHMNGQVPEPSWFPDPRGSLFPSQHAPIPSSLHGLGGTWEGQIQIKNGGWLELQIQGMPPFQEGQLIRFQFFGTPPGQSIANPSYTGIIRHIKIFQSPQIWGGTMVMRVQTHESAQWSSLVQNTRKDVTSWSQKKIIIGQLIEEEMQGISQVEAQSDELGSYEYVEDGISEKPTIVPFPENSRLQSRKLILEGASGERIIAYHDYPTDTDLSLLPLVVVAPGYGETKRDYLPLSYYFASNGYHVIRYDHTNHVGESTGNHFDISLSSMKRDFHTVIQYVHQKWPHSPLIGVASSLASRVALKAEAEAASLELLVLLMGIVDVQHSVATIHQEDVFSQYLQGEIQDSANILGFNVGRHFLQDALINGFSNLASTLEDVQSLRTPVLYLSAGKDAWIDKQSLAIFKNALHSHESTWLDVPDALHRLQDNPKIARMIYRQIVQHCRLQFDKVSGDVTIREPNRGELGRQNRREKQCLKQRSQTIVGSAFWSDYLGNFQTVGKCQEYVQLLDHVFHTLGPMTPGQQFLDAGCGNGNAGLYFLHSLNHLLDATLAKPEYSVDYVGIDVVGEALKRAQYDMTQASRQLNATKACHTVTTRMSWLQVDLNHSLPFIDNQFDRIVSNLVLGYLANPQAVLLELFRVLAPGGRMVISNLKPNGDFSGIYQNLVSHVGIGHHKVAARDLLNNYGKIRQAEKEGRFQFFHSCEWVKTLERLDCVGAHIYPTFATQAYLVVLENPKVFPSSVPIRTQQPHLNCDRGHILRRGLKTAA